jgi:hypothetical protein
LENSVDSVAFLIYLSFNKWHLITLAKIPSSLAQILARDCVAFIFGDGLETLVETPIDVQLPDKLAAYSMWFVLKKEQQQFLKYRKTAFRDSRPRRSFEENFIAGTFQSSHEEFLFEISSYSEAEPDMSGQRN